MDPQAFTPRDSFLCRPDDVFKQQPNLNWKGLKMGKITCKGGDIEDALRFTRVTVQTGVVQQALLSRREGDENQSDSAGLRRCTSDCWDS